MVAENPPTPQEHCRLVGGAPPLTKIGNLVRGEEGMKLQKICKEIGNAYQRNGKINERYKNINIRI